MKWYTYVILFLMLLSLTMCGAIKLGFSGNLNNCVFTNTDALNGTFTGSITNGTGEMANLTTATGSFSTIINPDGSILVLSTTNSSSGRNVFTITSNHFVDANAGTIKDTNTQGYSTYTHVQLVVKNGLNKGTYASKSATSTGTTDINNTNSTLMNLMGNF